MKVLIVAKTRRGNGACIGAISSTGQSLRLEAANAATDETAGMEYEVGEVWEIEGQPAAEVIPPHVENFTVFSKRRLRAIDDLVPTIDHYMPPIQGSIEKLYDGCTGATGAGALYVSEAIGVPSCSTLFWIPDRPLRLDTSAKRLRYRYPTSDGGRTLTFVGFQEPLKIIEPGTHLRVSLAHWWRPKEKPEGELRCYVQLSGWVLAKTEKGKRVARHYRNREANTDRAPTPAEARRLLKQLFGFDSYLPLQEEIVANLLAGRDTLAIMPTGSGKSLCYQLPALLLPGLTVVVSPLISLMQDQVDQLRVLELPAVYLNSTLPHGVYRRTMRQIRRGAAKLLYVAPETLMRPEIQLLLDDCRVDCLAVDEAHCISAWGHDFRPVYRQLSDIGRRLPDAVRFALTATATPQVREDIRDQLNMPEADTLVASFDRPNLFLSVQHRIDGRPQLGEILANYLDQAGIIYCSTRSQVDTLAARLAREGWSVRPYHAGLETDERQQFQRQFIHDEIQIIVATVAFGMGINKPNVRFVIHYNVPKNLESYYQQIGRAGRDGLQADCHLLFSFDDIGTIKHFINQGAHEQKDGAQRRLQKLIDYSQTGDCRRRPLLAYFGENYAGDNCGMCDNCLAVVEEEELQDVTEPAQKFLSCVKRTGEMFGAHHIIKVLRGSKAKTIISRNHHHLSTYNIGGEFTTYEWLLLAEQFINQGLLIRHEQYRSLRLTDEGKAVLKGRPVRASLPESRHTQPVSSSYEASGYDADLFAILREKRRQLAAAAGLPPFVIFHDRSLRAMATNYPQTETAFANIYGVGRVKQSKYGAEFLPLIRDYCQGHEIVELREAPPKWDF
jgi:ATP-dependent DNA helicase RecQ